MGVLGAARIERVEAERRRAVAKSFMVINLPGGDDGMAFLVLRG